MKAGFLCVMAAVLLMPIGIVRAEDIHFTSQAELTGLLYGQQAGDQARLVAISEDCCAADECVDTCCCQPWWGGFEGGLEVTLLNLYANHGAGEANGGNGFFDVEPDTQANLRYWVGYRAQGGLGLRARYWSYDSRMDDANFFDVRLLDLEATALVSVGKWDINGFAGVRWGDLQWSDENGAPGYHFDGIGPTLGVDVRRCLFGNVSLIAGVRGSVLYGDENEIGNDDTALNTSYYITEFRLGADYRRQMRNGGYLTLGGAWENQLYSSLSGNVDEDIDPEDVDITLAGPVFWISFER